MANISFLSYLGASTLFAALTIVFIKHWNRQSAYLPLIITASLCAIWGLAIAYNYAGRPLSFIELALIETIRYVAIIYVTLSILNFIHRPYISRLFSVSILFCILYPLIIAATVLFNWPAAMTSSSNFNIYNSLLLSLLGLVAIEQLYRNCSQYRLIKIYSIIFASLFVYDAYLFSYSIIFDVISTPLWQARGLINGTAALFMAIATLVFESTLPKPSAFSPSRPVAFYTTSLSISIAILLIIAILGYLIKTYGGTWGEVLHVLLVFIALLSIASLFVSKTLRAKTNVWINKHFFSHKYDYRVEWMRLINSLSGEPRQGELYASLISALLDIFKSHHGAIWIRGEDNYELAYNSGLKHISKQSKEPLHSVFIQTLQEQEWVFSLQKSNYSQVNYINSLLPNWIRDIPEVWLVLPLLTETDLLGFVVLDKPDSDTSLNWEDLDLLKTVGFQLASYIDRQHAADKLAESSQFETFNQLTAFIMHDIKNLIAQQKLIIENAAKHKDNPAFIDDAFETIENSVARMNNLLEKLQHDTPIYNSSINLHTAALQAVRKAANGKPIPELIADESLNVKADADHLIMTLFHLIRNAQDATHNDGIIKLAIHREGDAAIITISDNGCGMSQQFIDEQLFKPFSTTKSGKGMGIGAYQTKSYIQSLGGKLTVNSQLGSGTEFTIQLPLIK